MAISRHWLVLGLVAAGAAASFGCDRGYGSRYDRSGSDAYAYERRGGFESGSLGPTGATPGEPMELTSGQVARGVQQWVDNRGGIVQIHDPVTGEVKDAELVSIRRDWVGYTGGNTYVTNADFQAADGTMYNTDIFMTGTTPDNLRYQDMSVRQVNGRPIYTWRQDNGVWRRRLVPAAGTRDSYPPPPPADYRRTPPPPDRGYDGYDGYDGQYDSDRSRRPEANKSANDGPFMLILVPMP